MTGSSDIGSSDTVSVDIGSSDIGVSGTAAPADPMAARKQRSLAIAWAIGGFIIIMFVLTLVHLQDQAIGPCKPGYALSSRCSGTMTGDGAAQPVGPLADDADMGGRP